MTGWQFWIDRGGTFTDIVARNPQGETITAKLLSECERYEDAAIEGIRRLIGTEDLTQAPIDAVRMGTTVATNALLERKGEPVVLVTTKGFADVLRIGYQTRPDIFALHITLPEMLYQTVIEADERMGANGELLQPLDLAAIRQSLQACFERGFRAVAIVLMHGDRFSAHEQAIAQAARDIGFTQISASHEVSPLIRIVPRGDTTVLDAYVSPILRRYVERVRSNLGDTPLLFMQSGGGLAPALAFQGRDAILSGPAGGVVGCVRTASMSRATEIIGFDMGGTSTDVCHYAGQFERSLETEVAGVRVRVPMMAVHTVAAGGGSILSFKDGRFQVGPQSAGANPGPACYRNGGPLTVTDCNVALGRLPPDYFPPLFGPQGDQPLDEQAVRTGFERLAEDIRPQMSVAEIAAGFLSIAVANMANAIKHISVERGYDVSRYTLVSFGGAGGQHACLVAEALDMRTVLIHPLASLLSAYGIGLADLSVVKERGVDQTLELCAGDVLAPLFHELETAAQTQLGVGTMVITRRARLRYDGSDSTLTVAFDEPDAMRAEFEAHHQTRFGFVQNQRPIFASAIETECVIPTPAPPQMSAIKSEAVGASVATQAFWSQDRMVEGPLYLWKTLGKFQEIQGPALIAAETSTIVVEDGWAATVLEDGSLKMTKQAERIAAAFETKANPILLEVFNNLFMAIAEQMGEALRLTAHSVNIKERLDFSCAIFDAHGALVANAPHVPVHLGSMGDTIKAVAETRNGDIHSGDVFIHNDAYRGGTHLPDITVVTPVFGPNGGLHFYVASRGHHADIGGITPGSMPARSTDIKQEGKIFTAELLVRDGQFQEASIRERLTATPFPARNPDQNIADLKAQIAANAVGARELGHMIERYGPKGVAAYMAHIQDNAEQAVKRVLSVLKPGRFATTMDDGSIIQVAISVDAGTGRARIDFTGTSAQRPNNFNAPVAVCKAAVLYVFRTLIDAPIPLNAGCLRPLDIHIPLGCMLNPTPPAALVAGNVETSQAICDALYGALGVVAASQGTMNNVTFGNAHYQYYETICGGSGAGPDFDGADAVHTHMTNTRLTDPEIMETRLPIRVKRFAIRRGSGGNGLHRGGDGVIRQLEFLEPMTATVLTNRRRHAPFGLAGGQDGACGINTLIRADGSVQILNPVDEIAVAPGDQLTIETPGGGGYGKK